MPEDAVANGIQDADRNNQAVPPESVSLVAKRDQLVFLVVYSGFIISGVIALLVIGGVIFLSISGPTDTNGIPIVPEVLQNWGGIIVGFYFGTFVSLIKDYMKSK